MYPGRFRLQLCILLLLLSLITGWSQRPTYTILDSFSQLQTRLNQFSNDKIVVVNFWATWCKPCVEELPFFEQLRKEYADQNVEILLVSLDFKTQLQKKFEPFLLERNLQSEVILFADKNANAWIPAIHEQWDGAIPATLVMRGKTRMFHLGQYAKYKDLEQFVQPFTGNTKASTLVNKS
jgi:thiol-disulfide isomerase/thioredoxin